MSSLHVQRSGRDVRRVISVAGEYGTGDGRHEAWLESEAGQRKATAKATALVTCPSTQAP